MPPITVPPGVEGIAGLTELPDADWQDRWDRIILPAVAEGPAAQLPPVLAPPSRPGQPGRSAGPRPASCCPGRPAPARRRSPAGSPTRRPGPSTAAAAVRRHRPARRSRASCWARASGPSRACSSGRCPTSRSRGRPMVVLLDEVEALAVSRSRASLETNPVDVHRATDAVLSGVDRVARAWPNVTFVATTNYAAGRRRRVPVARRPRRGDRRPPDAAAIRGDPARHDWSS